MTYTVQHQGRAFIRGYTEVVATLHDEHVEFGFSDNRGRQVGARSIVWQQRCVACDDVDTLYALGRYGHLIPADKAGKTVFTLRFDNMRDSDTYGAALGHKDFDSLEAAQKEATRMTEKYRKSMAKKFAV